MFQTSETPIILHPLLKFVNNYPTVFYQLINSESFLILMLLLTLGMSHRPLLLPHFVINKGSIVTIILEFVYVSVSLCIIS